MQALRQYIKHNYPLAFQILTLQASSTDNSLQANYPCICLRK